MKNHSYTTLTDVTFFGLGSTVFFRFLEETQRLFSMALLSFSILFLPVEGGAEGRPALQDARIQIVEFQGDVTSMEVAVLGYIGSKLLYQTPFVSGEIARWEKSFRANTVLSRPLVLKVVVRKKDKSGFFNNRNVYFESKEETIDDLLQEGMDGYVADYGTGRLDEYGKNSSAKSHSSPPLNSLGDLLENPVETRCSVRLRWPPPSGEGRFVCGKELLVLRITHLY